MTPHTSNPTSQSPAVTFRSAARSDRGKVRAVNEDSYLERPGMFVVADGMGGHKAGDVASQIVVDRFIDLVPEVPVPVEHLTEIVTNLNAEVRQYAHSSGHIGMGTTMVAALWATYEDLDVLAVVNVGDSRCYISDDSGVRRITHDHSLVQDLVDAGSITSEEASKHPDRNVVTRAVGVDVGVQPDFIIVEPASTQRLLLCSDGVCGQIEEQDLVRIVIENANPQAVVDELIDAVLTGPAPDNATAVVIDVKWASITNGDIEITAPRPGASSLPAPDSPAPDSDVTSPRAALEDNASNTRFGGPTVKASSTTPLISSVPGSDPAPDDGNGTGT